MSAGNGNFWNRAFFVLLIATALVVLAFPAFPSQDGPVHLYYVDIIRDLIRNTGPYPEHFALKTFLTPYTSEYAALLALELAFPAALAEKVLVCGYIFLFGLCFRYLVESVTARGSPWILAGIPFCMHNLVYMGFMNYSTGVTLAMFLSGYWIRHAARLDVRRMLALLACFVLMLLTHPVPAAVFLVFAGLHFVVVSLQAPESLWAAVRARVRMLAAVAGLGVVAVLWLSLFMKSSGPAAAASAPVAADDELSYLANLSTELRLSPLVPFIAPAYRALLLLLVLLAAIALVSGAWKLRARAGAAALAALSTSAICCVLYAVVPISINGSFYFPQRFPIFWLAFLFTAAAAFCPPPVLTRAAGIVALAATVVVVALQYRNVAGVMPALSTVFDARPVAPGTLGIVIGELPPRPAGFSFDPYFWAGAHYFRRSHAILANAPWLDLPIIMLQPKHPNRWNNLTAWGASSLLDEVGKKGDALPELTLAVRQLPAAGATASALARMRWNERGGAVLGIYTRPEGSARVMRAPFAGTAEGSTLKVLATR